MGKMNGPPVAQAQSRPMAPHFDALTGPVHGQDRGSDITYDAAPSQSRLNQNSSTFHTRRLPIRTGRPRQIHHAQSQPVAASLYSDGEYKLRRKTPKGTVDAGYDGSSLSPGPPPLKHVIVATGSQHPYVFHLEYPHSRRGWTECHPHHGHRLDYGGQDGMAQRSRMPRTGSLVSVSSVLTRPPGGQLTGTHSICGDTRPYFSSEIYQPFPRMNDHHVRAVCHPFQTHDFLPFEQSDWQMGSSPWSCDLSGQLYDYVYSPDGSNVSRASRPRNCSFPAQPSFGCSVSPNHIREAIGPGSTGQLSPRKAAGARNIASRDETEKILLPEIQEKALLHAHRCHNDLLEFLQANGRANPLRTNSGISTSMASNCGDPLSSKTQKISHRLIRNAYNSFTPRVAGTEPASCNQDNRPPNGELHPQTNDLRVHFARSSWPAKPLQSDASQWARPDRPGPWASTLRSSLTGDPIENAVAALAILKSICEQGDWTWLEGLLLGGCLHYGLENYEAALTFFSRILDIDPSHVETVTNLAATLFCLNRQGDAERFWLRAVELRPSYLEATEHLVGLLYKKRSREAVNVISAVQRSLKVAPPKADLPDQTELNGNGYASSGYALPGCENGRILALIHAKGTMLYGLKEVDKASEAFEEALMISVGWKVKGIHDLIRCVQTVLSSGEVGRIPDGRSNLFLRPLMLPPERARFTAQLVFSGSGELPGLLFLRNEHLKRAAVQTTSNSLLSLAKIFQDSMSSGNPDPAMLRGTVSVCDILALYYLSLSLQESPSTANNVGILLAGIQHTALNVPKAYDRDLTGVSYPGIPAGSGMALALSYYNYGLRLDSKHVHLHTNLGSLLKDIGQLDLAIQMYERAVSCDGTFDIALTNLANAVKDKGRINDAIAYYRRAVMANPDFAEAVCGLFTALNSVCNWRGRGGAILASGEYDRWHVDDEGKLIDARVSRCNSGLTKRVVDNISQQLDHASRWGQHVLQESVIVELAQQLQQFCESPSFRIDEALRQWVGKPWEGSRLVRLIERAMRVILRQSYLNSHVQGSTRKSRCLRPRLPLQLTTPAAPTVLPFHTFTCPLSASHIRAISQRNAMRISCSALRLPWLSSTMYPPPPPPNPQLNVGYISSDFNNHPLAHLMQSVFGIHDVARVRAVCYATTASDRSAHRQQIEREAPVFRDVSTWPPEKIIAQIVQDQIHILVNLNGYTRGARNEIFAARPAPIQMSFMGFAGSLGAEWCDYILADTTSIPAATLRPWRRNVSIEDVFSDGSDEQDGDWIYSENVIFCKDTFFCCDHAQSSASDEKGCTWDEEKHRRWKMRKELFPALADDSIIMGNFNQLYKIEPTTFRLWLRILTRVPKAVLWLLRFPDSGERNLRATAEAWAGHEVASRLIFTDVAPKSQHIARARVCDIFLDTPECNAHTTAADVLWSSTPLLTLPRYPYKMCSRMAASILLGALPRSDQGRQVASELIAKDETEYEQMAVDLAGSLSYVETTSSGFKEAHGRLAEIRHLLWKSKWSCGLFDTQRWVQDLEKAYQEAWQRWVSGKGGDIYL